MPSFIKTKNTIRFETNGILLTIRNQKTFIETTNILSLKLHLESIDQGMPLTLVDYSRKQKRGNGNTILIQTEAFAYNCDFYIGAKNDMLHLIKALNTWQIEGLNIEIERSKRLLSS